MKWLGFMFAPLLLMIAVLEIWFRVVPLQDEYVTYTGIVEPDADLIWRLKPQATGPLATNELGLRDLPLDREADFRILVIGDSVAWGNGIDDVNALFPVRLEQQLNGDGSRYDVINAGVPGYSTFQELGWLERDGLALEPDLVVLQFCLNDVVERYRALAGLGGNTHFLGVDTRAAVRGLYGVALRRSRAFEAAARSVQSLARDREQYYARNLARDELSRELVAAWQRVEDELEGILTLVAARQIPLVLLIAPYRFQLDAPAELRQPQDRLLQWAGRRGVPVIDVLAFIARLPPGPAEALFNDESHFSAAGHALVATLLRPVVVEAIARAYPQRLQHDKLPSTSS